MKTMLLILLLLTLQVSVEANVGKTDSTFYRADTTHRVKPVIKKPDPVKVKKATNLIVQIITSILAFLYLLRQ